MGAPRLASYLTPSAFVLVGANLFPLYGVLVLGWEVFPLVFLFWIENLVIGILNVFRILFAQPGSVGTWLEKILILPFFVVHYGMFTMVHGLFVLILFSGQSYEGVDFPTAGIVLDAIERSALGIPVLALAASHTFSFFFNYLGRGENRSVTPRELMSRPYGRVVVMHITIVVGGMLLMALRSPVAGLALLLLLKIGFDLQAHVKEREKLGGDRSG